MSPSYEFITNLQKAKPIPVPRISFFAKKALYELIIDQRVTLLFVYLI